MKQTLICMPGILSLLLLSFAGIAQQTEIMLIATDHFQQVYKKDNPNTDILIPKRQKEIDESVKMLGNYKPNLVMVERQPEEQPELDSLYKLYQNNKLDLTAREDGRDEVYQIAFRLAGIMRLSKVYGVNAPGGSSQSMLASGTNIEIYEKATTELRKLVMEQYTMIGNGALSFREYLIFLNSPVAYNKVYQLRYIIPSRVTDARFKNPDKMVDTAFINPKYIGAELSALFKNRDYKIYSNIITTVMKEKPKRVVLLIGTAHIGSLKSILRDDPAFKIIETDKFLK